MPIYGLTVAKEGPKLQEVEKPGFGSRLPRRSWRQHLLNAELFQLLGEISAENPVTVSQGYLLA